MRRMLALAMVTALSACDDGWVPAEVGDGTARYALEDPATGERIERFDYGPGAEIGRVDYLFVVDPSISMDAVVTRVRSGFQALADSGAFPVDSRIGVLSAVAPVVRGEGERAHASRGFWVKGYSWLDELPGYGRLVDDEQLTAFHRRHPRVAEPLAKRGCGPWFSPGDVAPDGTPCLVAHTSIVLRRFDAEPGLGAVDAALRLGSLRFRPGAAVNVIFVSDTHHPGLPAGGPKGDLVGEGPPTEEQLEDLPLLSLVLPSHEQADLRADTLRERLLADLPVAALRFHAIAPTTPCVEPWPHAGPTYLEAAALTDGVVGDICDAKDDTFVKAIVDMSDDVVEPVFTLGRPVDEIRAVSVDGLPVGFAREAPRVVRVDTTGAVPREVDIRYAPSREPAPAGVREVRAVPITEGRAPAPSSPATTPVAPGSPGTLRPTPAPPAALPSR